MKLTELNIKNYINEGDNININKIKAINLHNKQISSININTNIFTNLEYLNLCENNIIDTTFLEELNSLYYLDLRKNPILNYKGFEKKRTFGYLALSEDKYFLDNFISHFKRFNIGIFLIENKTEANIYKMFNQNNPSKYLVLFLHNIYDKLI